MEPTKIVDRKLILDMYYLSEDVAKSLGKYLSQMSLLDSLVELELGNNGLKDGSLCHLLAGISQQKTLKKLHIAKNEIGVNSSIELNKILEWPEPYCLQELILEDVQTTDFVMINIAQTIKNANNLPKLQLSKFQLSNNKVFSYLRSFVKSCSNLQILKLAWAGIKSKQLATLGRVLVSKEKLTHLDLSYNVMQHETSGAQGESIEAEFTSIFIEGIRKLLMKGQLFHMNLSGMNLGRQAGKLLEAI